MKRLSLFLLIGLFVMSMSQIGLSKESEEPLLDTYKQYFKKDYLSIGILMQYVLDYQNERIVGGNNGFSIANMRLQLSGKFDYGFGYFFQTNFISSPAIWDAYMNYSKTPLLQLQVGQFKAPFSKELLVPASSVDLVNRSRVVTALAPARQIGLQVSGSLDESVIHYLFGLFNGNGFSTNNNDNQNFMYAGRLAVSPKIAGESSSENHLEIGVNGAYSEDRNARIVGGLLPRYRGERLLFGGDVRLVVNKVLLASEFIYSSLDPDFGSNDIHPKGFHATAGYMASPKIQLLMRWDNFDSDNLSDGNGESNWIIWGVNYWPTSVTELQCNYIVDTENADLENHQVLINAQISF